MVDVVTATLEDQLADPRSIKLEITTTYANNRTCCTIHPQRNNIQHATTKPQLIKIVISGSELLDPSTLRIMLGLTDDATADTTQNIYPLGGQWKFFIRMRIHASGQVVADIDSYNMVHELFQCNRQHITCLLTGIFGNIWQYNTTSKLVLTNSNDLVSIPPASSMTVVVRILQS